VALGLGGILIVAIGLTGLTQELFGLQAASHATTVIRATHAASPTLPATSPTAAHPADQVTNQIIQGTGTGGPIAPSALTVHNDDHVATVSWQPSSDSSAVGYKVTWGPRGDLTHSFFTPYTEGQIQPLDDGKTYQVQVQAVNGNGGLSAALGPATAQTDPTYVNQLRQQMNGLFDDFNTNGYSGELDPTKWYLSYNNAAPGSMGFVFDAQHHLHLFLENGGDDDRASMTMRALRPFDFTNRTGTVAFDFDWGRPLPARGWSSSRYQWYLVLSPTLVDDINYDAITGDTHGVYPSDAFEIFMDRDSVHFRKVVGGQIAQEWTATLDDALRTINVRKHSVFQISQNTASLTINGATVLAATGVNLDFQRAWVYNQQFQYNLTKDHIPFALSHWDNIGFDAPPGYAPDVLHDYSDGVSVLSDRQASPATWRVTIPDSLGGAKAERLLLDARNFWDASASGSITVNGVSVPWPNLGIQDNVAYDTRVIDLPIGTLHTGANTISMTGTIPSIQNVHVEVAFPSGSAAPYTPTPWGMASVDPQAMIPAVGPSVDFGDKVPADGAIVTGKIAIEVKGDGGFALLPTGHVNPVTRLTVNVDGVPALTYVLPAPTVTTDQVLLLDTSRLTNGQHVLSVTAAGEDKNADGTLASQTSNVGYMTVHDTPDMNQRTITVTGGVAK
jgi:hypothetical protein